MGDKFFEQLFRSVTDIRHHWIAQVLSTVEDDGDGFKLCSCCMLTVELTAVPFGNTRKQYIVQVPSTIEDKNESTQPGVTPGALKAKVLSRRERRAAAAAAAGEKDDEEREGGNPVKKMGTVGAYVHISRISDDRVEHVDKSFKPGQKVRSTPACQRYIYTFL